MNDEIQKSAVKMTDEEFANLVEMLGNGIQLVLDTVSEDIEFVLCVRCAESDNMGMSTNAQTKESHEIIKNVEDKIQFELKGKLKEDPTIILPH